MRGTRASPNPDADQDVRVDGALKLVRYFGFGDDDVLTAGGVALGLPPWPGAAKAAALARCTVRRLAQSAVATLGCSSGA
jgi:hypothetical protein